LQLISPKPTRKLSTLEFREYGHSCDDSFVKGVGKNVYISLDNHLQISSEELLVISYSSFPALKSHKDVTYKTADP